LREFGIAFFSALLSVLHLCQSVILSGFARMPGDLGDGRFNNLILEHVYRSWKGIYPLWSPGQFYPVQGTLAYSDNHLGTAIIYAGFRLLGFDIENAFQGWLLVICLLNAFSLYLLLRELDVSPWICVPCVFLGTSSCALVVKFGHPQILPFFPFILSLFFLLRAWRLRNFAYVVPAILAYTYQHFCYLYDGYFCTWLSLFLCFALAILSRPWPTWRLAIWPSLRRHLGSIVAVSVFSLLALLWIYYPYLLFSRENGTRSLEEVVKNSPRWSSWFSASPFSYLYHRQNFLPPATEINPGENFLFTGWIVWALGFVSLPYLWVNRARRRIDPAWPIIAGIFFTWLVILFGVTSWSAAGQSPYLFLCRRIDALRAFRCVSRIAYPLGILQAVFAALLLQQLLRSTARTLRILALLTAWLLLVDNFSIGELSYSRELARDRAKAVLDQWRTLGASKPLLFAPGYTNQASYIVNLDAWSAALRNKGETINGYSGNIPGLPGFSLFLSSPIPEYGRLLLGNLKIPESSVAFVTTWNPSVVQRAGIIKIDVLPSIRPRSPVKTLHCRRAARIEIPVVVHYQGASPIVMATHNVSLSYRIFDDSERTVDDPPTLRTAVPPLQPDQTIGLDMMLVTPQSAGQYTIHLSMVHEGVAWWEDEGWGGDVISLVIE
jgi:hypothetical protein